MEATLTRLKDAWYSCHICRKWASWPLINIPVTTRQILENCCDVLQQHPQLNHMVFHTPITYLQLDYWVGHAAWSPILNFGIPLCNVGVSNCWVRMHNFGESSIVHTTLADICTPNCEEYCSFSEVWMGHCWNLQLQAANYSNHGNPRQAYATSLEYIWTDLIRL